MKSNILSFLFESFADTTLVSDTQILFSNYNRDNNTLNIVVNLCDYLYYEIGHRNINKKELENITTRDVDYISIHCPINPKLSKQSISFFLLKLVREIYKYDRWSIESYELEPYEGYLGGMMCKPSGLGVHSFSIYVNPKYWEDIRLFKLILATDPIYEIQYDWDVDRLELERPVYKQITNLKAFNIVSTNTKTRRLKYILSLAEMINESRRVPKNLINRLFESHTKDLALELENYKYNKGLIKMSKTGSSGKHYVNLANSLSLLNQLNGYYTISPLLKTYLINVDVLKKAYPVKLFDNFFKFDEIDCFYWLEILLEKDSFYLCSLVEVIYLMNSTSISELTTLFQNFIVKKSDELIGSNVPLNRFDENYKYFLKLQETKSRIQKWEKPEKYLEHILMPRVNWLMDLGIIQNKEKRLSLTLVGSNFLEQICLLYDLANQRIVLNQFVLDNHFTKLFYKSYYSTNSEKNEQTWENSQKVRSRLNRYIKDSFLLFKTMAPNRVTASQAIQYSKAQLYLHHRFVIEKVDIENYLKSDFNTSFDYYYHKKYNDGYIQIKNK